MKLLGLLPDNLIEYISVKIHGDSMLPSFSDGDTVVFKTIDNSIVLVGDIVLAIHPFKKKINIVKRVTKINSCDEYFLEGDNEITSASSDSRSFGYISKKDIIAILKDII